MRGVRRLLAEHKDERFGGRIPCGESVVSCERGVVRFTGLMQRGQVIDVARSA
jgi:hypothetical protein